MNVQKHTHDEKWSKSGARRIVQDDAVRKLFDRYGVTYTE